MAETQLQRYKIYQRISCDEIDERRLKGLCMFCDEPETPDHYLKHKNSGLLVIEGDEDLVPNDEETDSSNPIWLSQQLEMRDGAANSTPVVLQTMSIQKPELIHAKMPVTETDLVLASSCVQYTNMILQHQVPISPLEHSHRFCSRNLGVNEDLPYAYAIVGKDEFQFQFDFECVNGNNSAYHVFDRMLHRNYSLHQRRKLRLSPKSWKFKYKDMKLLGILLGIIESDAGYGKQTVYEQITMVNEWLLQTSLGLPQFLHSFDMEVPFKTTWAVQRIDVAIEKENQTVTAVVVYDMRSDRVWEPGGLPTKLDMWDWTKKNPRQGDVFEFEADLLEEIIQQDENPEKHSFLQSENFQPFHQSQSSTYHMLDSMLKRNHKWQQVRKLRLSTKPWLFKFKQKLIRLKIRDKKVQIAMLLAPKILKVHHRNSLVIVETAALYPTIEYLDQFSIGAGIDKEHSSSSLRANQIWDPGGNFLYI